jgi:hypothetical protein
MEKVTATVAATDGATETATATATLTATLAVAAKKGKRKTMIDEAAIRHLASTTGATRIFEVKDLIQEGREAEWLASLKERDGFAPRFRLNAIRMRFAKLVEQQRAAKRKANHKRGREEVLSIQPSNRNTESEALARILLREILDKCKKPWQKLAIRYLSEGHSVAETAHMVGRTEQAVYGLRTRLAPR